MSKLLGTTALALLAVAGHPAWGQTAIGVGTGISSSRSDSKSQAVAIGGGNAAGGNSAAQANVTFAPNPAVTSSTINNTGTSTVRNVPSVFAPGLAAAGLETCLGSVSGGGSFVGTGLTFGTSIPDPGCAARLDARTLWSMGLKKAAVARLCLNPDIRASMPEVCGVYLPGYAPGPLAPVPGVYLSDAAGSALAPGQIMLIEGKTGAERLCNDYDATRQRCRVWAGGSTTHVVSRAPKVHAKPQAVQPPTPAASETEGKS